MVKILSFDVAVRTLGCCIIHIDESYNWEIKHWSSIDIFEGSNQISVKKVKKEILLNLLCDKLKNTSNFLNIDKVLIEMQPRTRNVMEWTSCGIATYFITNGICDIHFITPKNKFKIDSSIILPKGKSGYSQRKKESINLCLRILEKHKMEKCLEFFNTKGVKRDDMADALNQALYFIGYKYSR